MKKLQYIIITTFLVLLPFAPFCFADTFTNRQTKETLHGYISGQSEDGKITVHTQQKGQMTLNSAKWQVTADRLGRNNNVIILTIDGMMGLEIETAALERAITNAMNQGPLFVLLEIDTPGGRIDFARRICAVITETKNSGTIAFIKGGKYGGAISSSAAVALACNKIYMANNTTIGAATAIAVLETGPKDLDKVYGETVGEKFSSIWRTYLASLAEQNDRPALLARAMVDKDIEVIEVSCENKRLFIEPINKKPAQQLVRTWSKKDSLLALTAAEAIRCGIADKVIDSRQQLLRDLDAADAKIIMNNDAQKARDEFRKARLKYNRIRKSLDLKIKHFRNVETRPKALKLLRQIRTHFKSLVMLAKHYPDLELSVPALEQELNSVEAFYQKVKTTR